MSDEGAPKRCWTLEGARLVMPELRQHTETAVAEVAELEGQRAELTAGSEGLQAVESRMRSRISLWLRQMEALGVEVKGLWRVDFDNGSGYYCWSWPETALDHFRGYDEGFEGRSQIQ